MVRLLCYALQKIGHNAETWFYATAALYSRICYQQLGDKQGYFLQTSVGASGLCFGLQVRSFRICYLQFVCLLCHLVQLHTCCFANQVQLSVLTTSINGRNFSQHATTISKSS